MKAELIEKLVELPLKVVLNNKYMQDLLCTPTDIENLFRGFLFSQGFIKKADDIKNITFDANTLTVNITANVKTPDETPLLSSLASIAINKAENIEPSALKQDNEKEILTLVNNYGELLTSKRTKGLHAALLCDGKNIIFKEDVSRHCAIDKAVGEGIIKGVEPSSSILVTTGRISSEFLFKAKMLNIPMIASLKYPSATGKIIASDWGINLAIHINSQNAELLLYSSHDINNFI